MLTELALCKYLNTCKTILILNQSCFHPLQEIQDVQAEIITKKEEELEKLCIQHNEEQRAKELEKEHKLKEEKENEQKEKQAAERKAKQDELLRQQEALQEQQQELQQQQQQQVPVAQAGGLDPQQPGLPLQQQPLGGGIQQQPLVGRDIGQRIAGLQQQPQPIQIDVPQPLPIIEAQVSRQFSLFPE